LNDYISRFNLKEFVLIITLLLIALGLRSFNLDWGLPGQNFPHSQYNQDETAELYSTLLMSDRIYQLNVIRNQPAFYYLGFAYFMLLFAGGILMGRFDTIVDFQAAFESDLTPFFIAGRIFILAISVLTVALVYLAGKVAFNREAGLVGAIFLAVSFGHVVFSKIFRLDSLTPFLFLLSYYLIIRLKYAGPGKLRPYVICGLIIGFATATKVTGFALVIPYIISPLVEDWPWRGGHFHMPKIDRRYPFGLLIIGATYIAMAAPSFLYQSQVRPQSNLLGGAIVTGIAGRLSDTTVFADSYALSPYRWSLPWHITSTLPEQLSWPIFILTVLGLLIMIISPHNRRSGIYLVVTVFSLLLPVGYLRRAPWRDLVPILPLLSMSAGLALVTIVEVVFKRGSTKNRDRQRNLVLVLVTGLVIAIPLIQIGQYHYLLGQPDTREIAREWIETNIPAGAIVAYEPFSPDIIDKSFFGGEIIDDYQDDLASPAWAEGRPSYSLLSLPPSVGGVLPANQILSFIADQGVEYVVTSSGYYGRFYNGALESHAPGLAEEGRQMHNALASHFELLQEFVPNWQDEPGPVIKIYAVPDDFDANSSQKTQVFDPYPEMARTSSAIGYYQFAP